MTRQQLEDEYSRLLCLLAEPKPDRDAIVDIVKKISLAVLQWQDYAEGLVRQADTFRQLADRMQGLNHKLQSLNDRLVEQNGNLLRVLEHAGGGVTTGEWPSGEWCRRRCLEVG